MSTNEREKMRDFMEADFLPIGQVGDQQRIAIATEYAAHHLGQISKKLDKVIEELQALNKAE